MDVPSAELNKESESDTCPLLMERSENLNSNEHIINISNADPSSSGPSHDRTSNELETSHHEERNSITARNSLSQPSTSNVSSTRNLSFPRRGEARRRRSPLNSGLWISVELVLTLSQIVASIVVLAVSRHEHPHAPLLEWIVGYASGCVASLPLLYWRYSYRNQALEQDSAQPRNSSARINVPAGPFSISVARTSEGEDHRAAVTSHRNTGVLSARYESIRLLTWIFSKFCDLSQLHESLVSF